MTTRFGCLTGSLALVAALVTPRASAAQDVEAVIEWNRILQVTVASTPTPTVFFTRPFALTSIAVFDAINSIDRRYHPYMAEVRADRNASRAAAVAQAAHDVLVALYPTRTAPLAESLAATVQNLPPDAAREGAAAGAAAARACLEARAADGWSRTPSSYVVPNAPGYYQLTPPQNATVTFTHYPDVTPLAIGSRNDFLVGQPPALTSEQYANDVNEVKALGAATGSTRTEEETATARRWAGVNTSTSLQIVWNSVVRDLARRFGYDALEAARAYALLNVAIHDALLTSFNGKFVYGLWRPVTAIRLADQDGNPATAADPGWLPLLATPPYPSYPGNMACVGAAAARVLARIFGENDIPFTITWVGTPGNADMTRSFNGFREAADEEARSRVLGGIHFTFDNNASKGVCTPLADYVYDNYLRPRFASQ